MSRLYCINSIYLNQIQKGIQSLHATVEMFNNKTDFSKKQKEALKQWADVDKTVVMLDGQNFLNENTISELTHLFNCIDIPYGFFEEPCLNDTITSLCFILSDEDRLNYTSVMPAFKYTLTDSRRESEVMLVEILTKLRLSV